MEILLSIAIVTRNRPDLLEKCLSSLFEQERLWYEVIISDDSTVEEAIVDNKRIAALYNVRYLEGPKMGLYANRNFIGKQCTGTHIRTMDDDHTFPLKHITTCIQAIKDDPSSIWIIGEYLPGEIPHKAPHPCPGELHPRGFSVTPKNPQECRAISCGASIYPREVFDKNILNNEYFKFGSNYLEYGSRLSYLGYRIRHLSETYIFHNYDVNTRSFNNILEILDSKIYSILALSFVYRPSFFNRVLTIATIIEAVLFRKYSVKMLVRNLKRIKQVRKTVKAVRTIKI